MTSNWKLGLFFSLTTVFMWGMLPIALKAVLAVMDPLTISWYRFSFSAAIALLWYGYRRGPELKALIVSPQWWLTPVVVLGLLTNYVLYIYGLNHITPGAAQVLIQLAPLLLLIGSVFIFKEHLSATQWLGVVFLGVGLLLFFHQRLSNLVPTSGAYITGIWLIIGAAVSWCLYGLAQKQLLIQHHAKDILLLICVAGTLALWPFAQPMQIQTLTTSERLLLVFCGLNTIIAYGSFGLAMSYWESSRVSAILPITPLLTLLFTFALGYWQLAEIPREPMDGLSALGAVLVVAGAAAAALSRARTTQ